jgi:hypothetical protein
MTDEADFEVKATSTCREAERFPHGLSPLSITDQTDKAVSRMFESS